MPTLTARSIITKSFQKLGVLADGEVGTASQMNDALDTLNMMLNSWAGRILLTTAEIRESFPLVAAQASYSIGSTYGNPAVVSNFSTVKPFFILDAFIRDSNGVDTRILTRVTREQYNALQVKTTGGQPEGLFYDPGATQQTGQVGTIYLYPVPDQVYTLFIISEKPFTEFLTLDTEATFPLTYQRAIIHNLAIELYPEYSKVGGIDPVIVKIAEDSMRIIETINSSNKRAAVELGLPMPSTSNILTGR